MLTTIFFESWWMLAACWVAVQLVVITLWSWQRTPATKYAVWAGFALLPITLTISNLVVTDREEIIAECWQLAHAVEASDAEFVAGRLTDDFISQEYDKPAFVKKLRSRLKEVRLSEVSLDRFAVEFHAHNSATAEFSASARVSSPEYVYTWLTSRWRLNLRRQGGVWLIASIEQRTNAVAPLRSLADRLR